MDAFGHNRIADFFFGHPSVDKAPVQGHGRKKQAKSAPSVADQALLPLVEKDKLYFSLSSNVALPRESVIELFRRTFCDVWGRLPLADRRVLLTYWEQDKPPMGYYEQLPRSKPVIQIIGDRLVPEQTKFGHQLIFPSWLIDEEPERLPFVIAEALAYSYRFASRAHWRLVIEMVEDPLEQWEAQQRRQGKKVTYAARDRKLDTLEAKYLRAAKMEMAELLRRWGFEEPQPAPAR